MRAKSDNPKLKRLLQLAYALSWLPRCIVQETQEMWVQALGPEDPLVKGTATHSRILAWRIPWTEEPGGLQPMESHKVGHDLAACTHTCFISFASLVCSIGKATQ